MALAPGQRRVLRAFTRASQTSSASPKVRKALLEAGLTESNLQNLSYGDRDSLGSLQQRPSSGYKHATNPYLAALDFIHQAQPISGKYGSAGQLAQAVQRSAFPGRYQQHAGEAQALLRGSGGGAPSAPQSPTPSAYGGDSRQQIALSLLGLGGLAGGSYGGQDPLTTALLQAAQQGQARDGVSRGQPAPSAASGGQGIARFDGKPVEAWIAPLLKAARNTGIWKGSVTSGVRTKAQQLAAASHFGLQHYGAGGPLGSNHLAGRGAVDVSDPQGLARALAHLHMQNRLRNSMPQSDPVHFSKTGY